MVSLLTTAEEYPPLDTTRDRPPAARKTQSNKNTDIYKEENILQHTIECCPPPNKKNVTNVWLRYPALERTYLGKEG